MARARKNTSFDLIEDIANSEPIGGWWFILHVGTLFAGALTGWAVLSIWWLPAWWAIYAILFSLEKLLARYAVKHILVHWAGFLIGILVVRIVVYDALAIALWAMDGNVYQMGALALIVGATVNSFVSQGRFTATIASVAIPNILVFYALAALEFQSSAWSPAFWASMAAALFLTPYLLLSLKQVADRRRDFDRIQSELSMTQRLDSMGKIAAGVAHDFNNIMSVVTGSLELAKEARTEAERNRLMDVAIKATDHASHLTRQMLAFGKSAPLIPRVVSLSTELITFKEFAQRVVSAKVRIRIETAPTDINVHVDPGMLQSALLNLAVNAEVAMPNGGDLTIVTRVTTKLDFVPRRLKYASEYAVVSVSDTGYGIDEKLRDRVFEPFFSTNPIGKGSGLGLSMVKGFAEQSNGYVTLESAEGQGTTVAVFLPIVQGPVETIASPEVRQVEAWTANSKYQEKPHILVVEDNDQLRQLVDLKLQRDGFRVTTFLCADDVVAAEINLAAIDLVVSDQVMPGEWQGTDLLKYVKSHAPHIPVIIMSGYSDIHGAGGEITDADGFMEKPISMGDLTDRIRGFLSIKSS